MTLNKRSVTLGDYVYTMTIPTEIKVTLPSPVSTFPQTYNIGDANGLHAPLGFIYVTYKVGTTSTTLLIDLVDKGDEPMNVRDFTIQVAYNGVDTITITKLASSSNVSIVEYGRGAYENVNDVEVACRVSDVAKTKSSFDSPLEAFWIKRGWTVTNLYGCFEDCNNLVVAPDIATDAYSLSGNKVVEVSKCFKGCTALTTVGNLPANTLLCSECFRGCTSLEVAPKLRKSPSIWIMDRCFYNCYNLTTIDTIPNNVQYMEYCFYNCMHLTMTDITIPQSMQSMYKCFEGCQSLTGNIYVYADAIGTTDVFSDTRQPIYLYSLNNNVSACEWMAKSAENNNVYVNIVPAEKIYFDSYAQMYYNTNDGLKATSLKTNAHLVQCDVPNLASGSGYISTTVDYALVDLYHRRENGIKQSFIPRLMRNLQEKVIQQQNKPTPISPRIYAGDVNLTLKIATTGAVNSSTVASFIYDYFRTYCPPWQGKQATLNIGTQSSNIVTHASNVMIDSTTTLQDWIFEQYNNLTHDTPYSNT